MWLIWPTARRECSRPESLRTVESVQTPSAAQGGSVTTHEETDVSHHDLNDPKRPYDPDARDVVVDDDKGEHGNEAVGAGAGALGGAAVGMAVGGPPGAVIGGAIGAAGGAIAGESTEGNDEAGAGAGGVAGGLAGAAIGGAIAGPPGAVVGGAVGAAGGAGAGDKTEEDVEDGPDKVREERRY
jgi:hypothetical protein